MLPDEVWKYIIFHKWKMTSYWIVTAKPYTAWVFLHNVHQCHDTRLVQVWEVIENATVYRQADLWTRSINWLIYRSTDWSVAWLIIWPIDWLLIGELDLLMWVRLTVHFKVVRLLCEWSGGRMCSMPMLFEWVSTTSKIMPLRSVTKLLKQNSQQSP